MTTIEIANRSALIAVDMPPPQASRPTKYGGEKIVIKEGAVRYPVFY
jgi:hypothetical protein